MKVAVTGSAGRLGRELLALDWSGAHLLPWTRADAELAQPQPIRDLVRRTRPDVILHCASSTDLVRCETDHQYGWDNIALPAIHVARACAAEGIAMVQVSTDYVFSGNEPVHPIPPTTYLDPVNYYGFCKAVAEGAARSVADHLVVRCTMKARGPWKHPQAPRDMWISHSYHDEVARFLRDAVLAQRRGIAHFGARDVNVYEAAKRERPDVRPVQRSDITTLRLPGDVRLAPGEVAD